jgi:hypothetical protein
MQPAAFHDRSLQSHGRKAGPTRLLRGISTTTSPAGIAGRDVIGSTRRKPSPQPAEDASRREADYSGRLSHTVVCVLREAAALTFVTASEVTKIISERTRF